MSDLRETGNLAGNLGSGEPPELYSSLIRQIEQFRDTGGEGGCFAEVLGSVEGVANLALMYHQYGAINEERLNSIFGDLSGLVAGLPPLQTPEALEEARLKLKGITL